MFHYLCYPEFLNSFEVQKGFSPGHIIFIQQSERYGLYKRSRGSVFCCFEWFGEGIINELLLLNFHANDLKISPLH